MFSSSSPTRRLGFAGGALVALLIAIAVVAFGATAKSGPTTITAHSEKTHGKTEPLAVTAKGKPVYDLVPETTHHLLCTGANGCTKVWIPVTVARGITPTKSAGVKGAIGTFTHNGITQVTLAGHPVYTFADDTHAGQANGDGIASFGGTWHQFAEGAATSTAPTSTTTTATTSYGSGYSGSGY